MEGRGVWIDGVGGRPPAQDTHIAAIIMLIIIKDIYTYISIFILPTHALLVDLGLHAPERLHVLVVLRVHKVLPVVDVLLVIKGMGG
jgi:hypothetical protein